MSDLAARLVRLLTGPTGRDGVWLDGGPGEDAAGWLALGSDDEVRGERLDRLAEVEARWASDRRRPWFGWLTYEVGAEALCGWSARMRSIPGLCLRRYRAALRLRGDRIERVVGDEGDVDRLRGQIARTEPHRPGRWPLQSPAPVVGAAEYRRRVQWAREVIAAGETYQINLSQPYVAGWTADAGERSQAERAADVYLGLRRRAAPMGAFLPIGEHYVVSNSPETLVDVRFGRGEGGGDLIRSWPIKGTRPRGGDLRTDDAERRALLASAKDRAEHVMIVDLVRNDLGRICVAGSVTAAREPGLLTLPTVHHLVTQVRGTLRRGVGLAEVTAALFPGGSITGAPKRRTVQLIAQLEDHERGVYCGAIVALDPTGFRMSIPIRTGVVDAHGLTVCAGGGIVIDSDPEAERLETETKTLAFCRP